MTKEQLIAGLKEVQQDHPADASSTYIENQSYAFAVDVLLDYIDDVEVAKLIDSMTRWYS